MLDDVSVLTTGSAASRPRRRAARPRTPSATASSLDGRPASTRSDRSITSVSLGASFTVSDLASVIRASPFNPAVGLLVFCSDENLGDAWIYWVAPPIGALFGLAAFWFVYYDDVAAEELGGVSKPDSAVGEGYSALA